MLIIAADMHIRPGSSGEKEFLEFLNWVSETSADICFLGDVMELWIGVPGYETSLQNHFLDWCRHEKQRRKILFLEGNHEFFVTDFCSEAFTQSSPDMLFTADGALLFSHGDLCQTSQKTQFFLRWLLKSPLACLLLRWLPGAHRCVAALQRFFRRQSMRRRRRGFLPQQEINTWADGQIETNSGLKAIFIGHFHRRMDAIRKGVRLSVIPAWKEHGEICIYETGNQICQILSWRCAKKRIRSMQMKNFPQT